MLKESNIETPDFQIIDGKVILRVEDHICDTGEKVFASRLFAEVLTRCVDDLKKRNSSLLTIFPGGEPSRHELKKLTQILRYLITIPGELIPRLVEESESYFKDRTKFNEFVEHLYNYWRSLQRLIICDSQGNHFDERPYRTFNNTIETLTHVIRSTYRDVQENITHNHPRIYRQVRAGAEISTIALPMELEYGAGETYQKLNCIPVIRQVLIHPPLIFDTPMNKRTGTFEPVKFNPLDQVALERNEWLCYPAKVGELLIMVYFHLHNFELGFSLCNLFELADDEDLKRKPDAIFLFGTNETLADPDTQNATIFYDDQAHDLLVASIPNQPQYAYFGYLKKMILTLHNIKMMKRGRLPFHGALLHLSVHNKGKATILIVGDTGAGKSETIEALRTLAADQIQELITIADDMGSLSIDAQGAVIGYGSEIGAFVRLDDLKPGFAFGQIDRTILLNPSQTNARVVIPVSTLEVVTRGFPIDIVLYANNYEQPDSEHPLVERFGDVQTALEVFRAGKVMSKGTTTSTGQVSTFYANVFGPQQYPQVYDALAEKYFQQFFNQGVFVGQIRTSLGIAGQEQSGPLQSANALLELVGQIQPTHN